eukprot:13501851-Alexandrium_andersonii.AAC.1
MVALRRPILTTAGERTACDQAVRCICQALAVRAGQEGRDEEPHRTMGRPGCQALDNCIAVAVQPRNEGNAAAQAVGAARLHCCEGLSVRAATARTVWPTGRRLVQPVERDADAGCVDP